ncbi:MAG: NAD(P)-binding domain-containing protein, partial [Schleiferiaceae bacterium]|nr:NAD(P)-binding domain-containing protein [Schleiferiaceae bacterium]
MEVQSEIYPKVAVIGGGSFGTAVVKMVSENTGLCHWWMHNEERAAHIREYHHNPRYLSSVAFDKGSVEIFTDINSAIAGCDIVIFAVPSAFVKEVLSNMNTGALDGKLV